MRSVRTRASHGLSGSLAMRAPQRLGKSRSSCSASQRALPPRSVWRQLNFVLIADGPLLLGQAGFSEWSLMPSFPDLVFLLPLFFRFFASFALHPAGLVGYDSLPVRFGMTFASGSTISSSASSLRIPWEEPIIHWRL